MIRPLRNLFALAPVFAIHLALAGCGGVAEEPPPEEAPALSPEEQQTMESEIDKMREMYKNPNQKK